LDLLDRTASMRRGASLNLHARGSQNFLHPRDILLALGAPAP
jgi:hypothetical protein